MSIPQDAVELLKQEHAKHPSNPWMFPSGRTGEMYHPDSVVTLYKRILKDAGLPHIRFHDLRHTFSTLALQNGVDVKTVSSMLGHYDAGFTLRTYTHATRQMQQKAAEKMGSFMAQVRQRHLSKRASERKQLPLRCSLALSAHFVVPMGHELAVGGKAADCPYGSNACPPNGAMGQNLVSIFLGTVYSPCGSGCGSGS